jgi:NAD(P) transhydrogenase
VRTYDIVVIGSGPAGHKAAIQAAKAGRSVAVVERRASVGGVSVNTGTIPSKTFREAVLYLSGFRQRGIYGQSYTLKKDITIEDLRQRVSHVVRNEVEVLIAQFRRNGVDVLGGSASFVDAHTLRIETPAGVEEVAAQFVIVAVGAGPAHAGSFPVDGQTILDSETFFAMPTLPKTLTVVGGGVIGVEYATMAAMVGCRVTILEARPRILDFVDGEIVEALCYHMRQNGITLRLGEEVASVKRLASGKVDAVTKSNKEIVGDAVLYAAGRQGNTAWLKLENAGLAADARGRIAVDESFRTSVPHIFAVGDVVGFPSLASVSAEQGRHASCHALGIPVRPMPAAFPYGIYTIPEISYVGATEEELTKEGVSYETGIARYREIARGQILGDETGLMKILFHRETKKLLGVHIMGEGASELVHIGQAVISFGGTIDYLIDTVFNYPTLAECYKVAALAGLNKLISCA